ncbi:MAG: DUF1353 domain-containing protein [Patescibacteria group bacterium]
MENQIQFDEPTVSVLQNGNLRLVEDWPVRYGDMGFVVPAGFISDGNSVPVIFRGLVPQFGRNTLAGIIHDWLYKSGKVIVTPGNVVTISRRQADVIRLDVCNWCGVSVRQRLASYLGLRIGGGFAWRKSRRIRTDHRSRDFARLMRHAVNQRELNQP